jgi:hypothetical protein
MSLRFSSIAALQIRLDTMTPFGKVKGVNSFELIILIIIEIFWLSLSLFNAGVVLNYW